MWKEGTIGIPKKGGYTVVHYWAKVYEKKSKYGIEGGKISKATLKINGKATRTCTGRGGVQVRILCGSIITQDMPTVRIST